MIPSDLDKEPSLMREWRYERKYLVLNMTEDSVKEILYRNPLAVNEIFSGRLVNNIYFDTSAFTFYQDSVSGERKRLKVRIRWYGNESTVISSPVLELKIKQGQVGKKVTINLPPMSLESLVNMNAMDTILAITTFSTQVTSILSTVKPVLMNRYFRTYHLSPLYPLRFTIDSCLQATPASVSPLYERRTDAVVLEAKYSVDIEEEALNSLSLLPFRLSRVSKYVTGVRNIISY